MNPTCSRCWLVWDFVRGYMDLLSGSVPLDAADTEGGTVLKHPLGMLMAGIPIVRSDGEVGMWLDHRTGKWWYVANAGGTWAYTAEDLATLLDIDVIEWWMKYHSKHEWYRAVPPVIGETCKRA